MDTLLNFRDIFIFREDEESRGQAWKVIETALEQGVKQCIHMRREEGSAIEADFNERLNQMETLSREVESRAPLVFLEVRDRLQKRIEELLGQGQVDESRLAQEVAILAEKSDITEEMVRFKSHIKQFRTLLEASGPRGRQLEFVLQEMHREINTAGSKANDVEIGQKVIQIKTELERFREQLQNVE